MCCYGPSEVPRDEPLMEEAALRGANVDTQDEEFAKIEVQSPTLSPVRVPKVIYGEQNTQHHHRQGSNQMPKHIDSGSEQDELSDLDTEDKQTEEQAESELDDLTDDSISALEEPFVLNLAEDEIKEDTSHCIKDEGSSQHQRRSSAQISLQLQTLKVVGAGDPAINGVYRWFAAHSRFVMFKDQGQYQIMGGVNLSEYGDRYYDCWVIEEMTENVERLYAVASSESTSVPEDGWFCIDGSKPAPEVKCGEEREDYQSDGYMDTEGSDASLSPMPTSYWAANSLDGVEWVN